MHPSIHAANIRDLCFKIRNHPMCLKFEQDRTHYRVLYPAGMCLDGAQAAFSMGKTLALTRLLGAMEKHWKAS